MRKEAFEMARLLVLAAGVAAAASIFAAVIMFVGSPDYTPPGKFAAGDAPDENPVREALLEDARLYAEDNGVSLEEAARRLEMQQDPLLSRLHRELERTAPGTYAELRLRHNPDFGVTLAFTGDPDAARAKVEPLVEGTQWEGRVRIDRVELTDTELLEISRRADRVLARLGIEHGTSIDVSTSRVEFHVPDKPAFERRLRDSGLKMPDHVFVTEGMDIPASP